INEAGEATMSKFIGSEEKDIEKK
ncbi:sugar transferase, partial [Acinetobacter baumannii]|nr:sugar transferase [Acinetobacter baumannii]MDT1871608.1 sugar transferase [Acinetobacter baumannii]